MLTILHYIPSIDHSSGGVGVYMQLLARDLGKQCRLHVLTHASQSQLELENCVLHYIPYKWLPWDNCKQDFLSLLEKIHPDVFHTNSCWMPVSALTAIWAKEAGYKVVYTPHGMLEPWCIDRNRWKKIPAIWLFQRKGLQVCDAIHATSVMEQQNLQKLGWNSHICMIPNCVQLDQIPMKCSWQRTKTILYLSRIHPKKGIPFLIEAVALLKEQMQGYVVRIVGPGDSKYIKDLQGMTRNLGVEDIIHFEPPVFGPQKWELYRSADLFVLPTYSENFGIVVAEALACGTPVITTHGTPWEDLDSYHCGWWIEVGTDALVKALKCFIDCDDNSLQAMGLRGRRLIQEKYSSEQMSEAMLSLYQNMVRI